MKLSLKPYTLSNNIEKYIISFIKTQRHKKNFFLKIDDKTCSKLNSNIKKEFKYNITNSCQIINSIKSAYVKKNIIKYSFNLKKNEKKIFSFYNENEKLFNKKKNYKNLFKYISEKYILSPLNVMRFIIKKKYSLKITKVTDKQISKFDKKMIDYSLDNDDYALIDNKREMEISLEFEKRVEDILKKHNVKYKTQEQLVKEQIKKFGKPINTPDFLIISDFYINNKKVNWIDAKKFYGSCVNFVTDKIKNQTKKYLDEYGSGCIVFEYGLNELLNYDNIILFDYESFKKSK